MISTEVEELVNIIEDFIPSEAEYYVEEKDIAKALIDNSYHKTVWHKVSDGDLPEPCVEVLCQFGTGDVYSCGFYGGDDWCVNRINTKEVPYAWTEIPKHI